MRDPEEAERTIPRGSSVRSRGLTPTIYQLPKSLPPCPSRALSGWKVPDLGGHRWSPYRADLRRRTLTDERGWLGGFFQAGHAGSIPVTRSSESRPPGPGFTASHGIWTDDAKAQMSTRTGEQPQPEKLVTSGLRSRLS